MSDIIEMYLPPREMRIHSTIILRYKNVNEILNDEDNNVLEHEIKEGDHVLVVAKVKTITCNQRYEFVIWDTSLKLSAIVDCMLFEDVMMGD